MTTVFWPVKSETASRTALCDSQCDHNGALGQGARLTGRSGVLELS